jgi:phosphodiesterase/alkaline phosphatase D-like protein
VSLLPTGRWLSSPDLTASPSATVKTKSAIISWSTSRSSNSFVKYGTKSGDYGNEVGSSTQVTSHSVSVTNLEPGTTYYYKVIWADEDGNTGTSDELTFATNPAPFVSNVKANSVGLYSAFVSFTIKNAARATVQYGKTESYGGEETIHTATNESDYTVSLKNLTEGTEYNFRIAAEDDEDNIYYSDNYEFKTLPVPKIMATKVQQVADMPTATVRLLWTTNTNVTSVVTYYPSGYPERSKDYINLSLVKNHSAIIKDLKDETEYIFVVSGKDAAGNEARNDPQTVKTATDFRAPLIEDMNIETTIVGVGEEARAKLVIQWNTDEPSTTQVEYASGTGSNYSQTTKEDTTLTTNHTVTVNGLKTSAIYHLRAISKDKANNIGRSEDHVVITQKSTKGALELVIENLSKSFGFLKDVKVKQ